jgi:hypothetical protein
MRAMTAPHAQTKHHDSASALPVLPVKAVVGCCPVKEAFTGQGFLVVGWWQGGGKNCFQFSALSREP